MNVKSMRSRVRARVAATPTRIAATVVLATCGLVGVSAPAALALPSSSVDTYYYSSASMTNVVGQSHLSCHGVFRKSGKITPYYYAYDEPCN